MAALPIFISTDEAARQLGVSEARLHHMIEAGTVKAANASGEIVVSEASIRKFHKQQPINQPSGARKEDLPEYIRFANLHNNGIWARLAELKYGVPNQTIIRWVQKGFISILGNEKNKVLLNEQDVAYCAQIYYSHQGRGKWIFNSDGTPYAHRSENL